MTALAVVLSLRTFLETGSDQVDGRIEAVPPRPDEGALP